MKIAVVFDDLIQLGGAEQLLLAVHEIYPDAPVFTSLAGEDWVNKCRLLNIRLITSFMQRLPFKEKLNRFYGFLGLHTLAFESFDFSSYEVVLSISARFAHGVITKPGTIHICYTNSPGRMFWEPQDYFERENVLQNRLVRKLFWILVSPMLLFLRLWDYSCAQRVDYFIANSSTPKSRIKKYYRRDSEIIFPFADIPADGTPDPGNVIPDYFLIITRLNSWKRVDIAIESCGELKIPLKIIGTGPDKNRLEKISRKYPSVEFMGYVSEKAKTELLKKCKALIVTQREDFGITPLEAMYLGKPVIAYGSGGVLETVIPGVTGKFFYHQDKETLSECLKEFENIYDPIECLKQSQKFTKNRFQTELDEFIKKVYHGKSARL